MSNIEWTDVTWNPTTGCSKVSQGCKNCYAEVMHHRMEKLLPNKYSQTFLAGAVEHKDELTKPLQWKKPKMVFVNSMSDLFHEEVPFLFIDAVFSVMSDVDRHIYQVLTKRPDIMVKFFEWKKQRFGITWQPSPNVWLGVSVENQATADLRIPLLLQVPAAVRFLSCEPLLGPVNIDAATHPAVNEDQEYKSPAEEYIDAIISRRKRINWVIAGGESGHHARPMHPDWVRSLRDQCQAADVPFFFKQWGLWAPGSHIDFDKNIVFTNQGEQFNYKFWNAAASQKYSDSEWSKLNPCTMHHDRHNKKNNWIDGNQHLKFPQTPFTGTASAGKELICI